MNSNIVTILLSLSLLILTGCATSGEDLIRDNLLRLSLDNVRTGLPKVVITTPDAVDITSKYTWIENAQMIVYDAEGNVDYNGTLSIKGRGNSTWEDMPKKPYALKLDKKAEILTMPKHKRWCLLANWLDRTLMRNEIAYEIARQMPALKYTPQGRFVEVFLNSVFLGNYYLCEQIKVDKNRVNVKELDKTATTGLSITGGYIFEIDNNFDEQFRFMSETRGLPWQLKDPDEVNDEQFEYAKQYVNELEDALHDDTRFAQRDFAKLMDLDSFVDYWFVYELTQCTEPHQPRSVYMYKDMDLSDGTYSPIFAGPVWDFDYATFIPELSNQFSIINDVYYDRLFQDREFRILVKQRWNSLKEGGLLERICQHIDKTEQLLSASDKLNSAIWPITQSINKDNTLSFSNSVKRLKSAFTKKYQWLDYAISEM